MPSTKIIVVIGATGAQGSSVVSTFLSEPDWCFRGVTRNLNSDVSRALSSKGVEMVAADLDKTQKLVRAFEGANAIFAATDFFSSFIDTASQVKLKPDQTINEYSFVYEKRQETPRNEHHGRRLHRQDSGTFRLVWTVCCEEVE